MLERQLIVHCSPTLAGIKTANLFNYSYERLEDFMGQLRTANETLNGKGIYIEILRIQASGALLLTYRRNRLSADLKKSEVAELLAGYGYCCTTAEQAILRLKERLREQCGFPHEIGVFLGYPIEDVIGFINNTGKNCKCIGCWKVYGDERNSIKLFAQYKKCARVYSKLFAEGYSIMRLTVAA